MQLAETSDYAQTPVLMLWHFYIADFGACMAYLVSRDQGPEAQPLLNYTEGCRED